MPPILLSIPKRSLPSPPSSKLSHNPTPPMKSVFLALLLFTVSPTLVSSTPVSIAQAAFAPITLQGRLSSNSPRLPDGSYYVLHTFEGTAGQSVVIEMTSTAFDSYLMLLNPAAAKIAENDDGPNAPNAQLAVTLPATGTYRVLANSFAAGATGDYRITIRPGSANAIEQSPAIAQAEQLSRQVVQLYQTGRSADAIPLAEQALVLRQQALGINHPLVATSLNILAVLYQTLGRYDEAEERYQQSLEIREQQLGPNHSDVATSLNNLATLYQEQGRYREAEPLLGRSLDIVEQQFGELHPDVAQNLNNLASIYYLQNRYEDAEPLYQRALSIYQQIDPNHFEIASSLSGLALIYDAQDRYTEAEPLLLRSLAIREQQLGADHPLIAQSLNNLAHLYRSQNRYSDAESFLQRAITITQQRLGFDHPDMGQHLKLLADLHQAQGRYSEAEPLYEQLISIQEEKLGPNHPDVGESLDSLAGLYQAQGRYSEAETLLQRSLAIAEQAFGADHAAIATLLNNLANLYSDQGRYNNAEPFAFRALTIMERVYGSNHSSVATALNNLALLYQQQQRYGEAEPLYQRSLNIYEQQLGKDHPLVGKGLNNLAGLYQSMGRSREAELLYQRSLSIYEQQLGVNHPDFVHSLGNLAVLYQAQGRYNEAIRYLQRELEIQEHHLALNLATLTESQRQDYATKIAGGIQGVISLNVNELPDSREAAELALTTLLRRKGRLLDAATTSLQTLRQNLTPDDQALLDALTVTRTQLATLTYNPPPNLTAEQYQAELRRLETEANTQETTLARRSAAFRVEVQPITLAAVQSKIPANGVLVEFVRYRSYNAAQPMNPWGAEHYAAYLLSPTGEIYVVDLGEAAVIDDAVQSFGRLLQDPTADPRSATVNVERHPDAVEAVTGQIQSLVFDPIAPYLQGRQHLLISPDSQLNRLPFEALQTDNGQYLVEQYQISYLNSGRDLLKFGLVPHSTQPPAIFANPDYATITIAAPSVSNTRFGSEAIALPTTNQRSTSLNNRSVDPLPGTAQEAEAIVPLLPNAQLFSAASATETALRQIQAPRILHLATHGFFLEDAARPDLSEIRSVALARGEGDRAFATANAPIENPLLRSGLAMAGFNSRQANENNDTDDGVFTALEASNLNLFGTQLVVLSACDTGLGEIASGEGVYGLRRAFAIAGAETQLMSLWKVSDAGTQNLMTRYYAKLMSGMGRSEALRTVQLEMLQQGGEYARPYYWAAFILAGEWRSL
ncbi:tetratricopeptide repeat protein [Leptolyngbya sp. AN02str]|uniref:tetratricopeptide repeat protein n=1 Tax=Leptolyngbya sp. AN02str TaxID=3423363 RepID=UPI003D3107DB